MKTKCLLAVVFAMAIQAGWSTVSENSILVFAAPQRSRLWNTVPGGDVTLPVVFPSGATSAQLSVRAPGYSQDYPDITTNAVKISLPTATGPESEAVYELTLAFDDGSEQHARLAVIDGYDLSSTGSTACRSPKDSVRWGRIKSHSAVIPIPAGPRILTVDGIPAEQINADDSATWFQVAGIGEATCALVLTTEEGEFSETLSLAPGFLLFIR